MRYRNLLIFGLAVFLLVISASFVAAAKTYSNTDCDWCFGMMYDSHSTSHYKLREVTQIASHPYEHYSFMGFRNMHSMPAFNYKSNAGCGMTGMHGY